MYVKWEGWAHGKSKGMRRLVFMRSAGKLLK